MNLKYTNTNKYLVRLLVISRRKKVVYLMSVLSEQSSFYLGIL